MPPSRGWGLRVEDILGSITAIQTYTEGMTFELFAADERTVDAVLRNFGVIGEAANHLPESIQLANPSIPIDAMRAMRNFVIHEYFGVSKEILWKTLQEDLPPLIVPLRALLGKEP